MREGETERAQACLTSHDVEFSPRLTNSSPFNYSRFRRGCLPLYSTGQRKNYGFVTFETEEALMRAVSCCFLEGLVLARGREKAQEREGATKSKKKHRRLFVAVCLRRSGRARLPARSGEVSVSLPRRCTGEPSELLPGRAKRVNCERKRPGGSGERGEEGERSIERGRGAPPRQRNGIASGAPPPWLKRRIQKRKPRPPCSSSFLFSSRGWGFRIRFFSVWVFALPAFIETARENPRRKKKGGAKTQFRCRASRKG